MLESVGLELATPDLGGRVGGIVLLVALPQRLAVTEVTAQEVLGVVVVVQWLQNNIERIKYYERMSCLRSSIIYLAATCLNTTLSKCWRCDVIAYQSSGQLLLQRRLGRRLAGGGTVCQSTPLGRRLVVAQTHLSSS